MGNKFIITTTDTIENCPIKKYIDTICSNIVIGTNAFSDIAASFTDFFGGKSDTYKRKMEIIYREVYKELKQKAVCLGANAIVGFKIDFDEISGKDKSMFMVSASGTACIIKEKKEEDDDGSKKRNGVISQSDVQKEIDRRYIVNRIKAGARLNPEWVEFLLENPQVEIVESLIDKYKNLSMEYNAEEITYIEKVILTIPLEALIPIVYDNINHPAIRRLISTCNLFDAEMIFKILPMNLHEGIEILSSSKEYYNINDLNWMKQILEYLNCLPNTGNIEVVKGGVFSKNNEEKFICENGHKNSIDSVFCEKCGINIKGLTESELQKIEGLKERCNIIENYIN